MNAAEPSRNQSAIDSVWLDLEDGVKSYQERLLYELSIIDVGEASRAIGLIRDAWRSNQQVFTVGNGGSAVASVHFITDWNKSLPAKSGRPFRGQSLTNLGLITAYANDVAYEEIFAEQIRNLGTPHDLLVAISGSGNSPNIIAAAVAAKEMGMQVVAVVGYGGGELLPLADAAFLTHSTDMQICEDLHLTFGHMVMRTLAAA